MVDCNRDQIKLARVTCNSIYHWQCAAGSRAFQCQTHFGLGGKGLGGSGEGDGGAGEGEGEGGGGLGLKKGGLPVRGDGGGGESNAGGD